MSEQLHKRFTTDQVKHFFERFLKKEFKISYLLEILGIKRRRFFALLKLYRLGPDKFSLQYGRRSSNRSIDPKIEKNILKELKIDKASIKNKSIPLWSYNYSYVRQRLLNKYNQSIALSTIISRAKKHDFYLKVRKKKRHEREVLTHHAGELIQHDSSFHLWAPSSEEKWYLITSIDDYSRFILYAVLVKRDTAWRHILALQTIALKYGLPFSFYIDCHSIFRFVRGRDELHYRHHKLTDDTDTQWKQVLDDCGIKPIYALSPQAKGKVERPYGWLQDHLVRTCVRENVKRIEGANEILGWEVHQYNYKKLHSTTREIPSVRFDKASEDKKSLFRKFEIRPPFASVKDIFCHRADRLTDPYCRVSINNCQFKIKGTHKRQNINIRIYPLSRQVSELRFWHRGKLMDIQRAKNEDLQVVQF